MAKVIQPLTGAGIAAPRTYSLRTVATLRLALGLVTLLGASVFLVGVCWDIQWHIFVGRDRTLVPPHLMMLGGILLGGLGAVSAVLIESVWARRDAALTRVTTGFADFFRSSIGAYVAGFAALDAAIAFPLDSYWHALYGIDVTIWAPFHVMIIGSAAIIPLGSALMLLSAANLGEGLKNRRIVQAGRIAAIVAFAAMLGTFTLLLADALDRNEFLHLGAFALNSFPFLSGLLIATVLVAALYAFPWRFAATRVIGVYVAFGILFELFVPPATSTLVVAEQLSYRRALGPFTSLSYVSVLLWFLLPLVVAPLLDLCYRRAQRRNWSWRRTLLTFAGVALLAGLPVSVFNPTQFLRLVTIGGILGFVLSLAIGFGGTLLGVWLGRRLGEFMRHMERAG